MLTRCGSCHSRAHFHTLFAGLNADCVFPVLSARARVPQRCWAYRSARQLSGALSRKLTWLTQIIGLQLKTSLSGSSVPESPCAIAHPVAGAVSCYSPPAERSFDLHPEADHH